MSSNIDEFLDEVDRWKFKVHDQLKNLTTKQRVEFWEAIGRRAREMGLQVVEEHKPSTRVVKRKRRTG